MVREIGNLAAFLGDRL